MAEVIALDSALETWEGILKNILNSLKISFNVDMLQIVERSGTLVTSIEKE